MAERKFQTIVEIPAPPVLTGYTKKLMFMGSCFTENIGNKLAGLKFDIRINPFGILYNPLSIANGIQFILNGKPFEHKDLISFNGVWYSFYHHGKFSSIQKDQLLTDINHEVMTASEYLKNTDYLFITFGTSWVFRHKEKNIVVSNCHKIPAADFERFRLSVDEIAETYDTLISELLKVNPSLKIVFTVSPVRHWKDGAVDNQRSKATLILSIEKIINRFGQNICQYFPAWEIVMDELRDYRFYSEDMIHLSDAAINHIREIFMETYLDRKSLETAAKVEKIIKAVSHRPMNKTTREFEQFLVASLRQTTELENEFPFLDLTIEKDYFSGALNEFKKTANIF